MLFGFDLNIICIYNMHNIIYAHMHIKILICICTYIMPNIIWFSVLETNSRTNFKNMGIELNPRIDIDVSIINYKVLMQESSCFRFSLCHVHECFK